MRPAFTFKTLQILELTDVAKSWCWWLFLNCGIDEYLKIAGLADISESRDGHYKVAGQRLVQVAGLTHLW